MTNRLVNIPVKHGPFLGFWDVSQFNISGILSCYRWSASLGNDRIKWQFHEDPADQNLTSRERVGIEAEFHLIHGGRKRGFTAFGNEANHAHRDGAAGGLEDQT